MSAFFGRTPTSLRNGNLPATVQDGVKQVVIFRTADVPVATVTSVAKLAFDTAQDVDNIGGQITNTTDVTVARSGLYEVQLNVACPVVGTSTWVQIGVQVNAGYTNGFSRHDLFAVANGEFPAVDQTVTLALTAGDVISLAHKSDAADSTIRGSMKITLIGA